MKNLILGTALVTLMAVSANTFAAPKSTPNENGKTEMRSKSWKNDDFKKKGNGKHGSCHHGKKHCQKK